MVKNCNLRDYRDEDVPRLVEVIRIAFAEFRGKLDPPSSAGLKTVDVVQSELQEANAIVAEVDSTIVGCVFYRMTEGERVYLDRLSVLPSYRRKGIARALMEKVEFRARLKAAKSLGLSVGIALAVQQEFYERRGYEFNEYGTHEGYDSPTYVKMKKELT